MSSVASRRHCIKRYSVADDVLRDHRFADATGFDSRGRPKVDFSKISEVVPLAEHKRRPSLEEIEAKRATRLAALHAELDAAPTLAPGLHLLYGALRRNETNPDQPLEKCCSFSAFGAAWDIPRRRVAAPPRVPRGYSVRRVAAAATRKLG